MSTKLFFKSILVLYVLAISFSCVNQDELEGQIELSKNENEENNNYAIIKSFDYLVENHLNNANLSEQELSLLFFEQVKKNGGVLVSLDKNFFQNNRINYEDYSSNFHYFLSKIKELPDFDHVGYFIELENLIVLAEKIFPMKKRKG
ncbi:hypothetical protein [Mongoliitalea lutea]|uniref:DUF4296 domain-containing protein n=1 Tax=Mongoliitalea lutea TaxID=849756 RepID=A0A8J3CVA9_9BACT|nr:hypothetical protein [Mongoliitalea lutea]GHB31907.1 hypothetical protein GCM10008106_11040 [Mongoliitalea lutea]